MSSILTGKKHKGLPTLLEPFELTQPRQPQGREMLVEIDVTVPPNYVTKLCIYTDDNIAAVVRDFGVKWRLKPEMQ
jgi:hypothetical protein